MPQPFSGCASARHDRAHDVMVVVDPERAVQRAQPLQVVGRVRSSVVATRTVMPRSTSRGIASTTFAKFSGPRIASFSIGSAESSEI